MMAEMSKWEFINQVIFVNPTVSIRNTLNRNNSYPNGSLEPISKIFPSKITPKISIYTPITFLPCKSILPALGRFESDVSLKVIRHLNKGKPYILFMNCPNISSHYILDELLKNAESSFFDFSDDFAELGYDQYSKELFKCNAEKYAKVADVVLTVNEHIKSKYGHLNARMHVIRNGTNYENFDRTRYETIDSLERLKGNQNPIVGYIGNASLGRIDSELFDFLLQKRPNWQFVFIGPAHSNFMERYANCENVHVMKPVNYQDLPCYMRYFDAAFIPFTKNENTKGNDLLKLHDFLAMGKPIVSTEIGGAKDLRDVIRIAGTPSEFLAALEKALRPDRDEDILKRKSVAFQNSWHNRIKELEILTKNELSIYQ